ncbi:MAG TPA: hypothetical protein VJN64_13025 [Terriglobales bacterium]|nr:hypothetical protein [Terriglobales bacterium]
MPRRILTESLHAGLADGREVDTYFDKVVKYIPSDIVGAWVAANGILKAAQPRPGAITLWTTFGVAIVLCALWTYRQTLLNGKRAPQQTLISVGAFVVWVYALGGPFPDWLGLYKPVTGALLLIGYTLAAAIVTPDKPKRGDVIGS